MDENKFWLSLWSVAAVFVISIGSITALYNANNTNKVHDLIIKGVDPISARCAITANSTYDSGLCTTVLLKK